MLSIKNKIDLQKLPVHIAIIMDGNGRWAKQQGNQRVFGYQNGIESVKQAVEATGELGIRYLTLYAFSKENWGRPKPEIDTLMGLIGSTIDLETDPLIKNNIRLIIIGDIFSLPVNVQVKLQKVINDTSRNTGLNLIIALSYSSKWEIAEATKKIALDVKNNVLLPEDITEKTVCNYLGTHNIPDPELLIRTGGEQRISNFLLWQIAYAEFYFTNTLWPDFRKENLYEAIIDFQKRERRFGKTAEQLIKCD